MNSIMHAFTESENGQSGEVSGRLGT